MLQNMIILRSFKWCIIAHLGMKQECHHMPWYHSLLPSCSYRNCVQPHGLHCKPGHFHKLPRIMCHLHTKNAKQVPRLMGQFTNYIDRFLALFDPHYPLVDCFACKTYLVNLTYHEPLSPLAGNVVCELPQCLIGQGLH